MFIRRRIPEPTFMVERLLARLYEVHRLSDLHCVVTIRGLRISEKAQLEHFDQRTLRRLNRAPGMLREAIMLLDIQASKYRVQQLRELSASLA